MKKRTKKVLSFGVAALMAVSALPFSALSVSASIPTKQTENGGTPYNFLLEEQGSGVQTISISKDEIAAGDVTKTLDVFIDSEEWPDDNYLSSVKLNWVATKDATFADGGAIANSIYYQNVFNASTKVNQHDVTMPNGLGTIVGTPYSGAFCMSPMFEEDEDLHTWSYNDAQSNGVVREIACDKIFGANLIANGDNKVKFEYDYYANADDYLADKNADKATHKSHKVQECDVKQKEDGTPYIEYSYINPGGEVAANYVEKTVTVDLPCYSTTRFVKDSDGNDCVPDINNYYSWGFIAASSDDRTYFVGGKSTDLRFTSFDVVVPKDTAEGTYYVQICSRNANKDLIPMPSAADFDSVKADQENYRATVGPLEDMSTAIQGKKDASTYSLPQDPSKAIVKIVVGDGTVTDTTTTAAETTTTENSTTAATTAATTVTTDDKSDEFAWKIGEVACEPGDKKVKLEVTQTNGISTTGIVGSMIVPEATRKILSVPSSYKKISNCFKVGNVYPALSQTMLNTQEYSETGRLVFSMSSNGSMGIVSGNTLAAFTMDVADKDTVTAAAKEAGLELKSDKNGKYYLFPVTWMEDGVDIGYSDDGKGNLTPVEVKRFDYRDTEDNDVHTQVKYIDGGWRDNMPLDLAAAMGAGELLAVDVNGVGITRPNTTGLLTRIIRSHWNLGPTLDFAPERAARNIALGYFDTMRLFDRMGGTAYGILPDSSAFLKNFAERYQLRLAEVAARSPAIDLVEKTARQLANYPAPFAPNPSAPTAAALAPLELAAEHLNVPADMPYTPKLLAATVMGSFEKDPADRFPALLDGKDGSLVAEKAMAAAAPEEFVTALVSRTLADVPLF